MKRDYHFVWFILLLLPFLGCKKDEPKPADTIVKNTPVAVNKTVSKKVYVHIMPWFDDKSSGSWGIHWTMANKNPDVEVDGKKEIAAYFYPMIGPYSSGNKDVIEYQLLLMKLSGIDGVIIDWPGTIKLYDYPLLVKNAENLIAMLSKVGLTYAMMYEDQNVKIAFSNNTITDKIEAAKKDMAYMEANYFNHSKYIKIDGKPLLMVFGPQTFLSEGDWTSVFSELKVKPDFFTLWHISSKAGANASGEFAWVYKDYLSGLSSFYNNSNGGNRVACVYPGFKTYYAEGGWAGPDFIIEHNNTETFKATLDLALASELDMVQIATWNDYGEGTMIEPTAEFGYSFLTTLQKSLGVEYTETELMLVAQLYELRIKNSSSTEITAKLDQVFIDIASLKLKEAKDLLESISAK